jgi:hypothetical protein
MLRPIPPIARCTLLGALRNRLLWLALIMAAAGPTFTRFLQDWIKTRHERKMAP